MTSIHESTREDNNHSPHASEGSTAAVSARSRAAASPLPLRKGGEGPPWLAVGGVKGGIAKTTTAAALSEALALNGLRVLVADMDPQASLSRHFSVRPVHDPLESEPVALDVLAGELLLLPGGQRMRLHEREEIRAHLDARGRDADVGVLDCGPAMDAALFAALDKADLIVVPVSPSPLDLPAIWDMEATLRGINDPPDMRVLLTKVLLRRRMLRVVEETLSTRCGESLLETRIPHDQQVIESAGSGGGVVSFNPSSRAAGAYRRLTLELADLLDLPAERRRTRGEAHE